MSKLRKREVYGTTVAMVEATFAMMAAHKQVDDGYTGVTLHGIKKIVELVRDLIAESEVCRRCSHVLLEVELADSRFRIQCACRLTESHCLIGKDHQPLR